MGDAYTVNDVIGRVSQLSVKAAYANQTTGDELI